MLKFFLYVFAGILGVAFGVLVFLHQCVHLPQSTPTPSPTNHSVGERLVPSKRTLVREGKPARKTDM
jgi:hypothetical protein